jgi:hypothetical protein
MLLFGAFVLTLIFIFFAPVGVRASETSCLMLFDETAAEPVGAKDIEADSGFTGTVLAQAQTPADQARANCLDACTNRCQRELERCGQERTMAFVREKCVPESDKCSAYCRDTQCPPVRR